MTDPSRPPPPPLKHISADGCALALVVLLGVVLLLPGLCSLIFMGVFLPGGAGGDLWILWAAGFLISGFGIAVLVYAVKHR